MTRLLRDRYLWYIIALLVVSAVSVFLFENWVLSGIPSEVERHDVHMTWMTLRNVLLLLAVVIAAWRFKVRGGLAIVFVIGLLLLPHIIGEVAETFGQTTLAQYGIWGAIAIVFSWLVGSRKRVEEALRRSGEKYRSLVNNVKLGVFRSTPGATGRFLEVNPAMGEITGYSRRELLQMNVSDLYMHPEERELILEKIASGARKAASELCLRKKDGTEITVSDTKVAVRDNAGRILFFDGILEDVTERKRAEEALRHAAEEWRRTFDSITDLVSIHDRDFKLLRVNKAYAGVFKMHPKELIGKTCYEVVHGMKKPWPNCPHKQALETKKTAIEEFFEPRLGIYLSVSVAPIFDDKGEVVATVHFAKDITERKRAEEENKRSSEFSETVLNSMNDAISVIDVDDYRMTRVNDAFLKQFEMKEEQVIGKTCYQITHHRSEPCTPPDDFCPLQNTVTSGEYSLAEHVHYSKNGEKIYVEVSTSPVKDENGKVIQVVHVAHNITKRKKIQEHLIMTDRLASVGEMASGIAHEINNPLTSVIGFTELLMQKDIPSDIKQDVKIINDSAQRVTGIVKRLLTFARQHKLKREYVDINEVIETTLALRAYEMETGNIKVTTRLAPDLPRTMADGGQLQQVFLNIIINAEKEMRLAHSKGNFLIKTETIDNTIRISFADDGPGIAEENLLKIFDPFFTTRDAGQGTGLGLSVCHGIIAEHNGRLYGKSKLGKGATFVVELPLVSEPEQPEAPEVAEPATGEAQRLTGARILVVDDESAIRQFLSRVLADEGYRVETVDNASDALDRIKHKRYNLILLDIKMPGMSGMELYKRVLEIAQPLAGRMVFITGDMMRADTRDFFSKTNAAYITKPFDVEKLKEVINRVLMRVGVVTVVYQ